MKPRYDLFLKKEWIENLDLLNILQTETTHASLLTALQKFIPDTNIVLTCNGTSALYLGMISLGLKENDEIIIPSFSYPAVDRLAKYMKLKIRYCDIKKDTFCMDPEYLKTIISNNTKAVCFINHLGYVGEDLLYIQDICKSYDALLFEDSAQGIGQYYNGQMAGSFGKFGVISFSGAKTISSGEGGLIYSKDPNLISRVIQLQNIELERGIGNYTMSALIAHILKKQIDDWDWFIDNKCRLFNEYKKYLDICMPFTADPFISYNSLVLSSKNAKNIQTKVKNMLNTYTRYKFYPIQQELPNASYVYETYIEIPQSFSLDSADIKKISFIINSAK